MPKPKRNPEEAVLAGEASTGSDEIGSLPSRIDRYSKAKARARVMQEYCEKSGYPEGEKLSKCANYLVFHHYYTVGKVRLAKGHFCQKHTLCPLCAIRRGSKLVKAYRDKFLALRRQNEALKAYMVTLTVQNGEDLEERFQHLRKGLQRLMKRRRDSKRTGWGKSEWCKVLGLVGAIEIKRGSGSRLWHPHTHICVLTETELCQQALRNEWFEITGDSHQVDVSELQNPDAPENDFVEVFKYALKFSTLELEDNYHAYQTMKGKRLVFSAGLFRGVEVPRELTDELLEDLPYIELFYRFLDGSGYNLTRYEGQIIEHRSTPTDSLRSRPQARPVRGRAGDGGPVNQFPIPTIRKKSQFR